MARSLAQVQSTLNLLYKQYDELAATPESSISIEKRQTMMNQMGAVRKEIEELEALEEQLQQAASGVRANPGVSYAKFEEPW